MTFFNPWAFGFAGLIPVIVALYLLKIRRRPVAISTLMFWQRVVQENQRRALFQRLRQWLSLLLHLLIFALLLLALARPTIDRAVHEGSSTVLVLDTRARMQATEADGETRFAKALRAAQAIARQAAPGRQMALASTEPLAGIRLGFSGDAKMLQDSLQACTPIDGGGDLLAALRLAGDLLASRSGEKRIVVFTDRADELPTPKGALKPNFVSVGTARENVAITHFSSRAVPSSPETFEILLEVANFSAQPWSGQGEITLDGRTLDVRSFALAAGERKTEVFSTVLKSSGRGPLPRGELVARLNAHDALPLDDTAYALLPLAAPRRVLLVTKGNWFLEKLLAADLRLRFELLAPDDYRPEMARQFDAVVLDEIPSTGTLLPPVGNFLFLKQSPFGSGGPEIAQPLITDVDSAHPTLRLASLEHVSLNRATALQVPAEAGDWHFETPLRFGEKPLLITGDRHQAMGEQRIAAFAFSVTDSDLPLRVAFPLMMAGTIHWLAGEAPGEVRAIKAGEIVTESREQTGEAGAPFPATFPKNGFQPWPLAGSAGKTAAVNTFDDAESDLRIAATTPSTRLGEPRSWAAQLSLGGWPLWSYLAFAAALLCTGEWWLFHRRQTE